MHFLKKSFSLIIIILSKFNRLFINHKYNFNYRVAIISLHKLGDTVFTIPAMLEYLKNSSNDVYIICYKESEIIYRQIIQNVHYSNLSRNDFCLNGRIARHRARKILQEIKPDIIIDMTGSITSASLIFSSRCYKIYGINEFNYKGIYNFYEKIRTVPHQIDLYYDSIRGLVPNVQTEFTGYRIESFNDGVILIHPFAGWEAKEWGLFKFVNLYNKLSLKNECSFIFPPGIVQKDILEQFNSENIRFIECKNTEHLIREIILCKLFISNDSGPLQIAALLKRPTFCIYGPTNPAYHVPFGKFHHYINKSLKCTPDKEKYCFAKGGRDCSHYNCMKLLSLDDVYESVIKLLAELEILTSTVNQTHDNC